MNELYAATSQPWTPAQLPLMAEWLQRYQAERGRAPVDKRGSFRAAARSALRWLDRHESRPAPFRH